MKVSVFSATKIAALFSLFTLAACGDLFTAPTITAPNNEVLESSAEVAFSGEPSTGEDGESSDVAMSGALSSAGSEKRPSSVSFEGPPHIGVRLNHLDAVDEVMVPFIANEYGVDHVHIGKTDLGDFSVSGIPSTATIGLLISGGFLPALYSYAIISCSYEFDYDLVSFDMDVNINRDTFDSDILVEQTLQTTVRLDDMDTEIITRFQAIGVASVTVGGRPVDEDADFLNETFCPPLDTYLRFGADGLTASLDTTWQFNASKSQLRVSEVDFSRFRLRDVMFLSEAATALYDFGAPIVDFFSESVTCSSADECISNIAHKHIRENTGLKTDLRKILNRSVSKTLRINEDVDDYQGFDFSYDVRLANKNLNRGRQTFYTQWKTQLTDSGDGEAECESNLTHDLPMRYTPDRIPGISALDVVVPYGVLGDALVIASKQGDFCSNPDEMKFSICSNDVTVNIRPNGELHVGPGDSISSGVVYLPVKIELEPEDGISRGYYTGVVQFSLSTAFDPITQLHSVVFGRASLASLEAVGIGDAVTVDGCWVSPSPSGPFRATINNYLARISIPPFVIPRTMPVADGSEGIDRVYMQFEGGQFHNPVIRFGNSICHENEDETHCVD